MGCRPWVEGLNRIRKFPRFFRDGRCRGRADGVVPGIGPWFRASGPRGVVLFGGPGLQYRSWTGAGPLLEQILANVHVRRGLGGSKRRTARRIADSSYFLVIHRFGTAQPLNLGSGLYSSLSRLSLHGPAHAGPFSCAQEEMPRAVIRRFRPWGETSSSRAARQWSPPARARASAISPRSSSVALRIRGQASIRR